MMNIGIIINIMERTLEKSLELIDKFFKETPKEVIENEFLLVDRMKIAGFEVVTMDDDFTKILDELIKSKVNNKPKKKRF